MFEKFKYLYVMEYILTTYYLRVPEKHYFHTGVGESEVGIPRHSHLAFTPKKTTSRAKKEI